MTQESLNKILDEMDLKRMGTTIAAERYIRTNMNNNQDDEEEDKY